MKKLCLIFLLPLLVVGVYAQENPHGDDFDISCSMCHNSADWHDMSKNIFNHDQTGFSLQGAHKHVNCVSCHSSLTFDNIPDNCNGCHTDYHKNELGTHCSECHNTQSWDDPALFIQQHNQTNFPLTGVHAMLDCESCHFIEQQQQFANTPVECSSCHLDVFMSTLSPDHQKAGFDLTCQNCHLTTTNGWQRSIFDHANNFPLSGGHAGISCEECHGPNYSVEKVACVDCHRAEYDAAVNPNHPAFSFSTDCQECHTGIRWERTIYSHLAESGFAIEGRHKEIVCTDCHVNNQTTGIPAECIGCHQQEYNAADEPNHIAAQFPTTCQDCHSADAWEPAKWDHDKDYFPIYSGQHRGEWNDCSDCHVFSGSYAQFECINCHAHRKSEMDDEHRGRRNYVYESQACFNCHPKGHE